MKANRAPGFTFIELLKGMLAIAFLLITHGSFGQMASVRSWDESDQRLSPGCRTVAELGSPIMLRQEVPRPLGLEREEEFQEVTVDVLFIYTPAAFKGAGSESALRTEIDEAMEFTNQVYEDSGTGVRFRNVHVGMVSYVESGDILIDRNRLRDRDAQVEEVWRLRETWQADVVCMFVEKDNYWGGGIANFPTASSMFSAIQGHVVIYRAHFSPVMLAHELGHLFGCDHNQAAASADKLIFPFARGHHLEVEDVVFRTIMAYVPGVWVPLFSSPDLRYRGIPTGIAEGEDGAADNARVIRATAPLVAAYFAPKTFLEFETASVEITETPSGDGSGRIIRVIRTGNTESEVRVTISPGSATATDREDFELSARTILFQAGDTLKEITFTVLQDQIVEGTETVELMLQVGRRDAASGVGVGRNGRMQIKILDDESGFEFIASQLRVAEGKGSMSVWVKAAAHLHPASAFPIVMSYEVIGTSADADVDFVAPAGQLVFTLEALEQMIKIPIIDDPDPEPTEQFEVRFGNQTAVVSIIDDDRSGSRVGRSRWNSDLDAHVWDIVPLPDGKILISGGFTEIDGQRRTAIARLNEDGSLDKSFNAGEIIAGLAMESSLNVAWVKRALPLADGRIMIAGLFTSINGHRRGCFARLNEDGSLDETFNSDPGADSDIRDAVLLEDGRVILVGSFQHINGEPASSIVRIHPDGSLDDSFVVDPGPTGWAAYLQGITLQADGKIIVTGFFNQYNGKPLSNIARLHPDGSVNTSFGTVGENIGEVTGARMAPGGRIYIYGYFDAFNRVSHSRICRLNQDGTVDRSFRVLPRADSEVITVLPTPNGDLILGGAFFAATGKEAGNLMRLKPDGSLDRTFQLERGAGDHVFALAFKDERSLLIGGRFQTFDGFDDTHLTQINIDHLDPTFTAIRVEGPEITMTLRGIPGQSIRLEQSSDLRSWNPVGMHSFEREILVVTDTLSGAGPRFCRAVNHQVSNEE